MTWNREKNILRKRKIRRKKRRRRRTKKRKIMTMRRRMAVMRMIVIMRLIEVNIQCTNDGLIDRLIGYMTMIPNILIACIYYAHFNVSMNEGIVFQYYCVC